MLILNFLAVWHWSVAHLVSHIKGRTPDESALEHNAEEDIWNNENFYDLHFHQTLQIDQSQTMRWWGT